MTSIPSTPVTVDEAPPRAGTRRQSRRSGGGRWLTVVAILAFTTVVIAGIVAATSHSGTPPNDDEALIDLQVFDVGAHSPLVGSYERFGGNQPGPLLFYLLAAPYRLFGPGPAGLGIGVVAITAGCVAGCVLVAVRRGGRVIGHGAAILLGIMLLARGGSLAISPWEPHVLLAVLALFVFLVWEYCCGTEVALPLVAAAATLLTQTWLGMAIFVAALGGLAIVVAIGRVVRHRRAESSTPDPSPVRAIAWAMVVLLVLWLPPVVEQFTRDPGNLGELTALRHDRGPSVGLRDGYRAVAIEFRLDAPWLTGTVPTPAFTPTVDVDAGGGVPVALLVFAAAAIVAVRHRARTANWLNLIVGTTIVAAVVSRALVFGGLFVWIAEPDRVVGMLCWFAAGVSLWTALSDRRRVRIERVAVPLLSVALVITAGALAVDLVRGRDNVDRPSQAAARLAARALDDDQPLADPVLVTSTAQATDLDPTRCCAPVVASILTRAGLDVVVPRGEANRYGDHRARPADARSEILITSYSTARPPVKRGYRLVATTDQLSPRARARLRVIDRRLERLVGVDPSLEEIAAIQAEHPEVGELFAEQRRLGDANRLALYRRR